ncbi:MAG: DNA-directed RNA polymerase subunit alpha [Microgenomates group bacterium GW2011_GWA1_48_10]|uniref:DNA-directed RNA polymerase subunit alpha n=1 Tax=Candidatus Gottesmanbacteria bacterium RIFCSPHIGHO2_01_FULL_47_48 TaxID=1798381 RepID=A0A1F6A2F4_9BACT|nr:MAG: DNA-directed RNA polymerase subunit alpha [Microgenomates group bacterium GW2011_GWA1_48_10]OGG18855.1 MAG: DNA-directed RNA polymerase subunit alpha [Candidatus Gottesmanbacteria bacterium RIFCSPHIGHO2_01_FULL_47_48]
MIDPNFKVITEEQTDTYGRFAIEPLDTGYAHTLGNALRRVLLSSLPGAAVTSVTIDGVKHQFQTLEGLREDIVEFVLNLKKLRVRLEGGDKAILRLEATGPGKVTAADIKAPSNVEVVNKDLHLGTLADKKSSLSAQIMVEEGFGYSLADERKTGTIGVIPLDAAFSPIVRVNYRQEATRVGRQTNLDRLVIEVWTDGTVSPHDAIKRAAKILVGLFLQLYEPKAEMGQASVAVTPTVSDDVLKMLIEELDLPTRLENALKNGGIETVGQLLGTPRKDLLKIKNLGGKSLGIVEEKLREKGVALNV